MAEISVITFVLSPTPLQDGMTAITVELFRGNKLEASTDLMKCSPAETADALKKCSTYLQGLGMIERQDRPMSKGKLTL